MSLSCTVSPRYETQQMIFRQPDIRSERNRLTMRRRAENDNEKIALSQWTELNISILSDIRLIFTNVG